MKIDILCNDGSPLFVTTETIYGDRFQVGVGGAELVLLTMAELWHNKGYDVTIYNDPRGESKVNQQPIGNFIPDNKRDYLIIFRSPNHRSFEAEGKKIWWSCDQYAGGSDFTQFSKIVDKIVCISPTHQEYFKSNYGIENTVCIDLPVRDWDYSENYTEKIPCQLLFSSVPHRGLSTLADCYEEIKRQVGETTLVITSDYRLWGVGDPNNRDHRNRFMSMEGVSFVGAIPRKELIQYQLQSDILAYPSVYEELFCIAEAEAQWAGCLPITSSVGATKTTNMGIQVSGNPIPMYNNEYGFEQEWRDRYINTVVDLLRNRDKLLLEQEKVKKLARKRFHPNTILKQWDEKVFNG